MIFRVFKRSALEAEDLLVYLDGDGERVLERYVHNAPDSPEHIARLWRHLDMFGAVEESVYHMVLSWRPGEKAPPTSEVTRKLLEAMGIPDAVAVAVRHGDRPHDHMHIALSRVRPDDFTVYTFTPEELTRLRKHLANSLNAELEVVLENVAPARAAEPVKTVGADIARAVEAAATVKEQSQTDRPGKQPEKTETQLAPEDEEALLSLHGFYFRQLPQSKVALDYLRGRGISLEVARRLYLGYAPAGSVVARRSMEGGSHIVAQVERLGLIRKSKKREGTYYDLFRNRLIFPVRDVEGRLLGLSGRALDDSTPRYLNQPGMPRRIAFFGVPDEGLPRRIYLVEGQFDALAVYQVGLVGLASIGGHLTREQAEALKKAGVEEVVVAYDRDKAGQKGAQEAAYWLEKAGIRTFQITLPEGVKDVAELLQKQGVAVTRSVLLRTRPLVVHPQVRREIEAQETQKQVQCPVHSRLRPTVGRALEEIRLSEVAAAYTELEKTSTGFRGRCPAHQERTPSFYVNDEKGYYCFGCGIKGRSPVSLVMDVERVDKKEALRILEERFGLEPSRSLKTTPYQTPGKPAMQQRKEQLQQQEQVVVTEQEKRQEKQRYEQESAAQAQDGQKSSRKVEITFCTSGPESTLVLFSERSQAALRGLIKELDEGQGQLYDRIRSLYLDQDPVHLLGLLEEGRFEGLNHTDQIRLGALLGEMDFERMGLYELFRQVKATGVPAEMHEVLVGEGVGYDLHRLLNTTASLLEKDLNNLSEAARFIESTLLEKAKELGVQLELPQQPHYQYLVGRRLCRAIMFDAQGIPLNESEQKLIMGIPMPIRQQLARMIGDMGYAPLLQNIEQLEGSLSRVHFVESNLRKMLQRDKSMAPVRQMKDGPSALKKTWMAWRFTYSKISMVLRYLRRGVERHSVL